MGIGIVSPQEIDEINILRASFLAMHRAIEQLPFRPERLLIDGNRFDPFEQIPHHCIVGGDARYRSIAAASILAKTYRDDSMLRLNKDFPMYGWSATKVIRHLHTNPLFVVSEFRHITVLLSVEWWMQTGRQQNKGTIFASLNMSRKNRYNVLPRATMLRKKAIQIH